MKNDPVIVAESFAAELKRVFNEGLVAVILTGSAARGDFLKGKSDVNLLVILSSESIGHLEKITAILKNFRGRGLSSPVFMAPDAIQRSLDSYPLEFLDFKLFHRTVSGEDPLKDIAIPKQPLRLQIERELRGKLLLLRQIYAMHSQNNKELLFALQKAGKLFTAVFQGILELNNQPIPADRSKLFQDAGTMAGFSCQAFQVLLDVRKGEKKENLQEIFNTFLNEIDQLVYWIDGFVIE
ncbi:MAG: nucleotidyltransferase domain-containing protein [bacterium]|nr:nucleotidyltransferase domain-containing protein [bacterium]